MYYFNIFFFSFRSLRLFFDLFFTSFFQKPIQMTLYKIIWDKEKDEYSYQEMIPEEVNQIREYITSIFHFLQQYNFLKEILF